MKCLQQNSCFSKLQTSWAMTYSMYAQKVSKGTICCCSSALASCQPCITTWLQAGPKEKLDSTAVSQPAIYVASLAALEKLKQDEGQVWAQTCTTFASILPCMQALLALPHCCSVTHPSHKQLQCTLIVRICRRLWMLQM